MTLPIRLEAGDPAPEAGVLVPLDGVPSMTWVTMAQHFQEDGSYITASHLSAIADAAAAPRPLREGDRVRVGNATATVCSTTDGGARVGWDTSYPFLKTWLPVEAVTRIEGDE